METIFKIALLFLPSLISDIAGWKVHKLAGIKSFSRKKSVNLFDLDGSISLRRN